MSLGLVAYDDSEEDSETEIESVDDSKTSRSYPTNKNVPLTSPVTVSEIKSLTEKKNEVNTPEHLRDKDLEHPTKLHIPESSGSLLNTDIDIKSLTSAYQKAGPVKISIPSLNEIEDEAEQPSKKKIKPSTKGSGLFALLPDPKSALVPQSVINKKKNNNTNIKQHTSQNQMSKPVQISKLEPKSRVKNTLINYEDSGDEESSVTDFFSLDSKDSVISEPLDVDVDLTVAPDVSQPRSVSPKTNDDALQFNESFHPPSWQASSSSVLSLSEAPQSTSEYPTSEFMTFSNSDLELDKEAMQQLCGRRDRLKMHEVNLIDVRGDAIMPDSREWLTKQLTEEQAHKPSHKKRDGPTSQQKRKHQITYLAYQAKENELELKNQWSNNRMSRKQTQAKYGF